MDTLRNNFHGTEVHVRDADRTLGILDSHDGDLSKAEKAHARRVRDALCGAWRAPPNGSGCTCGIVRGPQGEP
jgi:hypothetical protein